MTTYVALLRGINVGGRAAVRMEDLRALAGALGHAEVRTHIRSGNLLFRSAAGPADLARGLEERIAADLGLRVAVLLRSREDLAAAVSGNPFLPGGADPQRLHVTFLAGPAEAGRLATIQAERYLPDEFRALGREVYVHCPGGYGETRLSNTFFEARLGLAATTRNWNTVCRLLALAGG